MATFNENDIRPVDLLAGQELAVQHDINFLLENKSQFNQVDCPACASKNATFKYEKDSLKYEVCDECSTMYMNPRPSQELIIEFYKQSANYAYWNQYIFPASEAKRRSRIFVPRVDRVIEYCEKYGSGKNTILEVGAGFGTFCEEMLSRNYFQKIIGIEPTPALAETCRTKGFEVIEEAVEKIQFAEEDKVDVVVNFEVIEHLFSPKFFIEKCADLLKKDGLFVVTCPNGEGFDIKTLGTVSKTVDHEHVNYFNPDSLKLLLENSGFEVLESLTPGVLDAELVRNAVLEGKFSLENQPFLNQILIENWESKGQSFQNYLTDNQLSSNLWIIAKKK